MNKDVQIKNTVVSEVLEYLPLKFRESIKNVEEKIFEIRIKVNQPITIRLQEGLKFVSSDGKVTDRKTFDLLITSTKDMADIYNKVCDYSVYSHQEEIKNGFVTISGGHRVGICGTAVKKDNLITSIKNISSLNIRIAREIIGAADDILNRVSCEGAGLLLVGPPSCGKTTLLRDIARKLSYEHGKCVTVVDERCEIAATYNGVPRESVGLCDVMNGYSKKEGILQAIRTLSPDVIICDEIGDVSDTEAVKQGLNAGVSIIASIHADSIKTLMARPQAQRLISTGAFEKIVVLKDSKSPGQIKKIIGVDELYAKSLRINNNFGVWDNIRCNVG